MWIWDLLQIRKSKGYIEKFYDFVRPSSCNEASSICIVPKITSIFSSVSRPFDSPGYNSFNYDDLVALCTSLIIVCIWVISFKMYIDSLNENPGPIQSDDLSDKSNSFYEEELNADKRFDLDGCPRKLRKRKKTLRRHNRGRIMQSTSSPQIDEELSD
ncbi:uncharacterized protein LOC124413276 isoform X2 [Diprion similis]|uniref:uncharacterized protein LOC124413276 isoform X2 n=1 Tax=Diprion similis TaxID=362088 RepID=UPI001EF99C95|nr:uncharacterized protein LOC124413276 isoform X2 [Diprion similis]